MVETRFAEDEGLDKARQWWKKNGTSVIAGVGLGIAVVAGWNGWLAWTRHRAESAAGLYMQLNAAVASGQRERAADQAERLMNEYSGQPYAVNAALTLARVEAENSRTEEARRYLQWVLDNTDDETVRHATRLRLAQLALAADEPARALEILGDDRDHGAFTTHYEELRGDALMVSGDSAAAREAYERALAALTPGSAFATVLDNKIANAAGVAR
jgi:predicted negative regulator of RcsB-dependent stress response